MEAELDVVEAAMQGVDLGCVRLESLQAVLWTFALLAGLDLPPSARKRCRPRPPPPPPPNLSITLFSPALPRNPDATATATRICRLQRVKGCPRKHSIGPRVSTMVGESRTRGDDGGASDASGVQGESQSLAGLEGGEWSACWGEGGTGSTSSRLCLKSSASPVVASQLQADESPRLLIHTHPTSTNL